MSLKLTETPFIFLDCQTTGMRPPKAHLLEIAWCQGRALDSAPEVIESYLVQLPENQRIPFRVKEITGIRSKDMTEAVAAEVVFESLQQTLQGGGLPALLIHYAQFERPFLLDLYERFGNLSQFANEVFCSHKIAKKLFPSLPSRNIRGVAGFFGASIGEETKRATSHVMATFEIWKSLADELSQQGVDTLDDLRLWLEQKPQAKATKYEYRLPKEKRLGLPAVPGVYRMLTKSGDVLYVGKATSLKDRVNSYFRGKKGRDPRKLEMVAQVWDLNVTECQSALEAAVLETDEIKRLDPPYNVSLKRGRREFIFYSRDFTSQSVTQDIDHPYGPFRPLGSIAQLELLFQSIRAKEFVQIFFTEVEVEKLKQAWLLFCEQNGCRAADLISMRSLLALGMSLYREQLKQEALQLATEEEAQDLIVEDDDAQDVEEEDHELTLEEIAAKYGRLLMRAARAHRRARLLTRLLNSRVKWETKEGWRTLFVNAGRLGHKIEAVSSQPVPWANLDLEDYDRMSVLYSELKKHNHIIEWREMTEKESSNGR